jgi:signal transduction histidine kinase
LLESAPRRRSVSIDFVDREIKALTLTVNRLAEEYNQIILNAEKDIQYLKDSISDISHDMRTPLTSIIGYLQLLNRSDLTNEQQQNLTVALDKSQYLRKLLSDFYELAVLSANDTTLELKRIDLAGVVSEIIIDNANEFAQRKIEPIFELSDKSIFILGNIDKLQRIIKNLVENCLEYSCGNVIFTIKENDNIQLIIENPVSDIKSIDASRLFERFYKADISRSGQGTGLGLSIAKLLIESMGGIISINFINDLFIVQLDFLNVDE